MIMSLDIVSMYPSITFKMVDKATSFTQKSEGWETYSLHSKIYTMNTAVQTMSTSEG